MTRRETVQPVTLLTSAAIIALTTALAAPALAQDAEATVIDDIVVTGSRYQARAEITARRDAQAIVDTLSQNEIGQLPDFNIADAFRRVPGVNTVFDEDEGRFVTVRGLRSELNHVTIDGLTVGTTDANGGGGRNVNLETIPSTAAERLEVFKTFTPAVDGHAIGGYLNLRTRSAFAVDDRFFTASASIGQYDLTDVPGDDGPSGRFESTFSDRFGASGEFGLLASITLNRKRRDEIKDARPNYGYFTDAGVSTGTPLAGNGFAAPIQFQPLVYNNTVDRVGGLIKLEYQPDDRLHAALTAFGYQQQDNEERYVHQLTSPTLLTAQTATSGRFARALGSVQANLFPIERQNGAVYATLRYEPSEDDRIDAVAGFSAARFRHDTPNVEFRTTAANPSLAFAYDSARNPATYRLENAAFFTNPANYTLVDFDQRQLRTDDDIGEARIDYRRNAESDDFGVGFIGGLGYRRLERTNDNDTQDYRLNGLVLTPFVQQTNYSHPNRIEPSLFLDIPSFLTYFETNRSLFTPQTTGDFEASRSADFTYLEAITAVHGALTFAGDRLRATAGLRYETVEVEADIFRRLVATTPDTFIPDSIESDYDALLPSVNVTYSLRDALRLRAAYSQSIGRPNPSDIAIAQTVSADGLTITRGNPDLEPRTARNYDLALDYYFAGRDGLASVGIFYKQIDNEIFDIRTTESQNGTLITINQPSNAASAEIKGIELNLVIGGFDMLPAPFDGFGVSANATFIEGDLTYLNPAGQSRSRGELVGQPTIFGNLAVFYQRDSFQARVAYNHTGEFLNSFDVSDRPWLDQTSAAVDTVDLSARYSLNDHLLVKAEIRNVTDETRENLTGLGQDLSREQIAFGRSAWIGLTVSY